MAKITPNYKLFTKYTIAGALATVVCFAAFFVLTKTFLDVENALQLQLANVIAWLIATAFSYHINKDFVFKKASGLGTMTKFYSSRVLSLLVEMWIMHTLVTWLKLSAYYSKIGSQIISALINYIVSKYIVFGKTKEEG